MKEVLILANEFQVLTVETSDGGPVIRRKNISDITPKSASGVALSVSGLVAEFSDGADNLPLTALSVGIEAIQSGSGDPSPENIRTISGWTGAKIRRTGKNLWGGDAVLADVKDAIPSATADAAARTVRFRGNAAVNHATICGDLKRYAVRFKPDTQYTFFITGQTDGSVGTNLRIKYTDGTNYDFNFTAAGEKESLRIVSLAGKSVLALNKVYRNTQFTTLCADECGIFEGVVTAEEFEPYRGEEVAVDWESAAGEVYGGTLNVLTGELSVTHKKITVTNVSPNKPMGSVYAPITIGAFGTIAPTASGNLCNMLVGYSGVASTLPEGRYMLLNSSGYNQAQANIRLPGVEVTTPAYNAKLAELAEAGTPLEIVYALAEPEIYQLTPAQMTTLLGENRIFADSGDAEVTYTADTKTYIDNGDAADRAMVAAASGGTASRTYAVGEFLSVGSVLYRVTAAIASGETIQPGVNVTATTVGEQLTALYNLIDS